ncbi:MAG: hypothetical protein J7K96_09035 [Desulfobacteraceae bacterium]|nr:hypothetical protein [Desulfobacteraceae bacterium]
MLILDDVGKKSFLKLLYTTMIQDKILSNEEENTLELIAREIFQLDDYEETNLKTPEKTAREINKIKSDTAIINLVEILLYIAEKSEKKQVMAFLRSAFENAAISADVKSKIMEMMG